LTRNGYSLVMSAGMSSALGLVYWVLAARLYSAEEIGLNAALISTMMALGAVAQLNLGSMLTRFLPSIGISAAQRLIIGAYAAGVTAAFLSCALFFFGVAAWAPSLRFLAEGGWLAVWFTAATMIWTVFAIQEGVLAGLRKAIWVPVQSTAFSVAKIVLLLVFSNSAWKAWGPFASWTLPSLVAVLSVNALILRRLLSSRGIAWIEIRTAVDKRYVVRYFGSDFLGTLFYMAASGLAPILVVERVGAEGNAVYYLAWTISYSLYLVSKQMGVSLVAEGAANPSRSKVLAFGALAHTMGLLVVGVAVVVVAAPLILRLFGPSYAAEGSTLLRVLALSALPFGFTAIFLGLARVEGRMVAVVIVQGALAFLVLGLGVPLLGMLGTLGMGIAWLLAQIAVAAVLCAISLRGANWLGAEIRNACGTSTIREPLRFWRRREKN
jgi:O-antigen/teichoic acid export membrane protein